jgi:leucyl aminopeptidase
MEFPVKTGAPASQRTECAILPIFDDGPLRGAAKEFDTAARGLIKELVRNGDASGRAGSTALIHRTSGTAAGRLLLVGCGKHRDYNAKRCAGALGAALQALRNSGVKEAISYLAYELPAETDTRAAARITVEAARAALYRFDELKSRPEPGVRLTRLALGLKAGSNTREARDGSRTGTAIANGADLARNLGNRPANVCTPAHLAAAARDLAKRFDRMQVEVLGEREMKRLGMGAFLSVTQGAGEPAQLIVLQYRGAAQKQPPVAICGKGVTFDTGGISMKPPPKMDEMKFDMCGAAGVLGTMAAIGELQPSCNVVAVIPTCENMPGSKATRPGDIVKSMSGQTIEILNTDAEGRLILCDAMTYARRFKPRFLIDVATLTGACVVALGHVFTGVFTNDEELAGALLAAGRRSLDPAWRMPLADDYGETLRSNFADFANAGTRDGGASVAANFLSRFADGMRWAHLDIAGVAWRSNANKGATGRPVALLVDFLLNLPARDAS